MYTTIKLVSPECELTNTEEGPHPYQKVTYWLCRYSRDNQQCGNLVPREQTIGTDIGSRQGSCPVCQRTKAADEKYEEAKSRAAEEYERVTLRALAKRQDEYVRAYYVVETVYSLSYGILTRTD